MFKLELTLQIEEDQIRELIRLVQGAPVGDVELPAAWRLVEERHGVRYTWGGDLFDIYDPFRVYEAGLSSGRVRFGIGKCERTRADGAERLYYIVCAIGPQGGLRAVAEFQATDDHDRTREVIAIVKGKEGTGRQFDPGEDLPAVYARWTTATYRERVDYPGSYTKVGLVCDERDHDVMLNHALAQVQLRRLDV